MRMADDELAADFVADVADIERALLLGHTGVEHDLQHQVAQFLAEKDVVVVVDGLDDLIGLLDEIFADRPVRLLTVPGAAPGRAEQLHYGAEVGEVIACFGQKCGCFFVHDAPNILFL